jgi:thioredoxin 1
LNDNVHVVSTQTWEQEILNSTQPVLVDFWATWCAPCRALAPTIDALATQFAGKVKVAKLDVDENPDVAARFGVQSIPTLLVFKGGRVVEQRIGALPKSELERLLNGLLV